MKLQNNRLLQTVLTLISILILLEPGMRSAAAQPGTDRAVTRHDIHSNPADSTQAATAAADQSYARPQLLTEPQELVESRETDRPIILDARPLEAYEHSHIRAARWVDHESWKEAFRDDRDADTWSQRIAALGIDTDTDVVVYDGAGMKNAARIWWILRFWGVEQVSLLNGGWRTWQAAQLPVTNTVPEPASPTPFAATPVSNRLATMDQILSWLPNHEIQVVDARSDDEFCGIDKRDNDKGGAIPGAKHLEWSDLIDQTTHRFKPASQIRQLFQQAGIDLQRPTATHCNGGGRASVMAYGLELMGATDVRNYYRGWGEWGNSQRTPVSQPADPDGRN